MKRRQFLAALTGLAATSTALATLSCPSARKKTKGLSILVLGGTNFVGPHLVRTAMDRGHDVTLFNRGTTNPWLFSTLERLAGDRYPDRGVGLSALKGHRKWDVVLDTWQGSPLCVTETAALLRERTAYYGYVSSIAVYGAKNFRRHSFDETAELPVDQMPQGFDDPVSYPAAKRLGELTIAQQFGRRCGMFRAYGIVGPDARGRLDIDGSSAGAAQISYWPMRLREGGTILAPGDGKDRTQWTDVRDLAEFTIRACEQRFSGPYNVSSGAYWIDFLEQLAANLDSEYSLEWVPAQFLFDAGIESFSHVPGWVSRHEPEPGFFHADNRKALQAGLCPRAIADTFGQVVDAYIRYHRDLSFIHPDHGVAIARRERELLLNWRQREK